MSACKKDTVEKPDIPKGEDRDIRVLKVQYMGHDYNSSLIFGSTNSPDLFTRECFYHYDSKGRLSYIVNDDLPRVQVEYDNNQIKLINSQIENAPTIALYWMNSIISSQNNKIEGILATTRYPLVTPHFMSEQIKMNITRTANEKLKSVGIDSVYDMNRLFMYIPLNTNIESFEMSGLPNKVKGVISLFEDLQYPLSLSWDFSFQYNKADDVPSKLKRLINEEILFLNRYGVTNFDMFYMDSTRNYSQFGEGNWLISFGLPQYYILEDKSAYMVSQRVTDYYQLDSLSGEREFVKTKVEDFPYKHDAEAKTLEIAGLKIWYEFVD